MSDKQSAQEIISAFEEKQQLADLVTETLASEENTVFRFTSEMKLR